MIPGVTLHEPNTAEVAVGFTYPHYLSALGLEPDAYGAEVARRCLIEDLKSMGYSVVHLSGPPAWRLDELPGGLEAGERGRREFRTHYTRLLKARNRAALVGV